MNKEQTYPESEKWIDEVLKSEPDYSLPDNFANKVALKVGKIHSWNQYISEFYLYLAAFLALIIISAGLYYWLSPDRKLTLQFFISNISLMASGLFVLAFILFVDKVVLRYFLNHPKPEGL